MKKKTPRAPHPTRNPLAVSLPNNPDRDATAARRVHGDTMTAAVYAEGLRHRIGRHFGNFSLAQSAFVHAADVTARMAPRDPAEEMLVAQLLLTHSRVLHLTELANQQTGLPQLRTVHEYADRASNTYRRLMLALAEYRRPPRTGDSFTAIKQANIAGQQVIQNHENSQPPKVTNEQGFAGRSGCAGELSEVGPPIFGGRSTGLRDLTGASDGPPISRKAGREKEGLGP